MIPDQKFNEEWFVLEKLYKYPPSTLVPIMWRMEIDSGGRGLGSVSCSVMEYTDGQVKMLFPTKDWHDLAKSYLDAIVKDPKIADDAHNESDSIVVPKIQKLSQEIIAGDLGVVTNESLLDFYDNISDLMTRLQIIRCNGWIMETAGEYFSKYLIDYLKNLFDSNKISEDPVLIFSVLTNPTMHTLINHEQMDLLRLANKVKSGELKLDENDEAFKYHAKIYGYLPFGCEGPAWTAKDIVAHVKELTSTGVEVDYLKQSEVMRLAPVENEARQQELFARLPIDEKHKHLFKVARDIVYQKSYSKENQFLAWYCLDLLLREIAKRFYLTIQQARYLLPEEIKNLLAGNDVDVSVLSQRFKYSLFCFYKDGYRVLVGEDAKLLRKKINLQVEKIEVMTGELRGQSAVPGKAAGRVTIINHPKDMIKMKAGDILVSEMTVPEIVQAMKKASAIVTDMGGITCHAAIVSRELKIPCVIGTKFATQVLKDGDMVEVDATTGVIRKI